MPSTIGIVASGVIPFTPADLSPIAWWDASNAGAFTYSSGTSVSQWNSQVGSYALVQATAIKQPSRSGTVNGRSTVVFDGSNDSMNTSATVDMTGGQKFSIWYVATFASGTTQVLIEQTADFNSNPGAFLSYHATSDKIELAKNGGVYTVYLTNDTITTTPKSVIGTHDGTLSTNETNAWVNGITGGTRPSNGNTNTNNRNGTIYVGARNNASFFLNGQICELGITTTVLTAANISDLAAYLAAKWGL